MNEKVTQAILEALQQRAKELGDEFRSRGDRVQIRCFQPEKHKNGDADNQVAQLLTWATSRVGKSPRLTGKVNQHGRPVTKGNWPGFSVRLTGGNSFIIDGWFKKGLKLRRLMYQGVHQIRQPSFSRHFSKILELV